MCHKCGYACEKPNPLKIHIALDCGKSPRAKLWSRLTAVDSDSPHRDRTIEASFRFSLKPTESRGTSRLLSATVSESAFRPYSPESSASSSGGPSPPRQLPPPPRTSTDRTLSDESFRHDDSGNVSFFDRRCAEMETIVSNLGHSEQGHLCIYCGKVYSRKYGLKIHIRYIINK